MMVLAGGVVLLVVIIVVVVMMMKKKEDACKDIKDTVVSRYVNYLKNIFIIIF